MSEDAVLILAAGKGTRMQTSLPKVLHPLAGRTIIERVLAMIQAARLPPPTLVVGYGTERIRRVVGSDSRYVDQDQQLGTGHAVRLGLEALPASVERVVVIHGDEPLIPPEALGEMLARRAPVVLLTTHAGDTRGFGRVIRDRSGNVVELRQELELTPEERHLDEVNLGAYVFDARFLRESIHRLEPHPPKGEYYLTDLVATAANAGISVAAVTIPGGLEVMGINDLVQLEQATHAIYRRTNRRLMEAGVTILDSATTFVEESVQIEPDTIIQPFTIIGGPTRIGSACTIGPHAHILGSQIGKRCKILSSRVEESVVGDDVVVGPYANLGPHAHIGNGAEIGSHAQIRRSSVGARTRMHHFGYLGDARVGENVNIGAGTVTCNFDGRAKHQTTIEDGAFVGSDTMLRAPVTVGKSAATGAGSVVTRDVDPGTTVAGVPARVIKRE